MMAPSAAARAVLMAGKSVATGSKSASDLMPRGLAKRTAVPAALRSSADPGRETPTMSRRAAFRPDGWCSSSVSQLPAANSRPLTAFAAAEVTASSGVSSSICGSSCLSFLSALLMANTTSISVSKDAGASDDNSVFMGLLRGEYVLCGCVAVLAADNGGAGLPVGFPALYG